MAKYLRVITHGEVTHLTLRDIHEDAQRININNSVKYVLLIDFFL